MTRGRTNNKSKVALIALLLLAGGLLGGCSGDATGLTAAFMPRPGSNTTGGTQQPATGDVRNDDADAVVNAGSGSDPGLNVPGAPGTGAGTGNNVYIPAIDVPEQESFVKQSHSGEDDIEAWLKNCYETLPDPASPAGVYQNESLQNWAYTVHELSNRARKDNGLQPLRMHPNLEALAQAHARDMALRRYFSHDTPDGLLSWDRWMAIMPPYVNNASENAARGQETAQEVIDQWMSSPGHRRNLLNPDFEWTGVGVYFDPSDPEMPVHVIVEYGAFRDDPTAHDWYQRGAVWDR